MKTKILTLFTLLAMAAVSHGQFINKGAILAGGGLEFKSQKEDSSKDKLTQFSVMPWVGYTVINNLVVGAGVQLGYAKAEASSGTFEASQTELLFAPLVRYYLNQGVFFHGQFGLGSSKGKFTSGSSTSESKSSLVQIKAGAGYAVKIGESALFEPMVGFISEASKSDVSGSSTVTNAGFFGMMTFTVFLKRP